MVARFARNAPGTWFQKYRLELRGCRGNGATEGQLRQTRFDFGQEQIVMVGNGKQTNWPTVLPIKAALNQTFELLKTLSSPPFLWNRTATITFGKTGRASPVAMRIS